MCKAPGCLYAEEDAPDGLSSRLVPEAPETGGRGQSSLLVSTQSKHTREEPLKFAAEVKIGHDLIVASFPAELTDRVYKTAITHL